VGDVRAAGGESLVYGYGLLGEEGVMKSAAANKSLSIIVRVA